MEEDKPKTLEMLDCGEEKTKKEKPLEEKEEKKKFVKERGNGKSLNI